MEFLTAVHLINKTGKVMTRSFSPFKLSLIVLFCMISMFSSGQKLTDSRHTSYYTYIYKLTDQEAKKIYRKSLRVVDPSYFHTMVDSFPTDSEYSGKLPAGHYLKTFSEKNEQKVFVATVPDFEVVLLNNNTDLYIQVYDLKGKIIPEADLKIRLKKLRFDKKVQAYVDKKSNKKGLLKVSYNGYTAYYELSRSYNNSAVNRGIRKIIYGTPLKYVWWPVDRIAGLPVREAKAIFRGNPKWIFYRMESSFRSTKDKIGRLFNGYYYDWRDQRFQRKFKGYMVFNKPKYRPGDTVRFKAFIVTRKGKTLKKTVHVALYTRNKLIQMGSLDPYRKGGYDFQFTLADSLDIRLDDDYTVFLENKRMKPYISESFDYEDYELSKINLGVRYSADEQFRGKPFKVFIKGTDENNLNILDARLEVRLITKDISQYFAENVFVPDTLFITHKKLDPSGETEITIPDSAFPKANLNYNLEVKMLTSANEVKTEDKNIDYYFRKKEFEMNLKADSLQFVYKENGNPVEKPVRIIAVDNFGNKTEMFHASSPCNLLLNPYYKGYSVKTDSLEQYFDIASQASLVQCYSERTADSVFITVANPRNLQFTYNIYKRNSEKARGYADSLSLSRKSANKQNYYVSIRYLWGGKIKEETYRIPLRDKMLDISVQQPKIVYPGQKTRIEVFVKNKNGKPVQGVDVTAYSLTGKFDYTVPSVPYLGNERKNKAVINNFSFNDNSIAGPAEINLDYNAWKLLAGLDSIEYYKFIYPGYELYRFDYLPGDSITQFAPFVVSKGRLNPVQVIYVDSRPVYFSWSTNTQPYSFRIDSGYHQIKLRTWNKKITIDSLYFSKGRKLIFSLDDNIIHKNISIENVTPGLSGYEKKTLYKYIFPYRYDFEPLYAYIQQGDNIQFLKPSANYLRGNNLAGPVTGNVTFHLLDSFSINFDHEPFYEYDFSPGLLKMRSIDGWHRYPDRFYNSNVEQPLTDLVFTKTGLEKQWKYYTDETRWQTAQYQYSASTGAGYGKLQIDYSFVSGTNFDLALNVLMFKYDDPDFLRIYPGRTTTMHDLDPGSYRMIFFFSGDRYAFVDSIHIKANGLNYVRAEIPRIFQKDTFGINVSRIIEKNLFNRFTTNINKENEVRQIYNMYQQQFAYTGEGRVVQGYVRDQTTGEPLPGVNVLVKGTSYGTTTDIEGYYALKVPGGNHELRYSFVGFVSEDRNIGSSSEVNVSLTEEVCNLDEVVVIGYGVTRKQDLTGSVSTVQATSLLGITRYECADLTQSIAGMASGVQISKNNPGNGVTIHIRGASTVNFEKTPLYIIDGKVYTGDISKLDPNLISSVEVLRDPAVTAIYGAMAANGVVLISSKGGAFQTTLKKIKGAGYDDSFMEAAASAGSIRKNFSDYAFWQPRLITDKEGKASFDVTFPDDVTSWKTFYLAMNGKRQSGQAESTIKSYKPLMAQLAVPRFLVKSDTTSAIGKVLNYTTDSIAVTTRFEINDSTEFVKRQFCSDALLDTCPIIAGDDSLNVKYYLERTDGYLDGEQRNIPVYPVGLEETKGSFYSLDKDTTLQMTFDTTMGEVTLYARNDMLDVIGDEISHLIDYKYWCNEQIASKLRALLAEKQIAIYMGTAFRHKLEVQKLIRLLQKNQKENGLWGWWKNSEESYWISLYVLEVLVHADQMGYNASLDHNKITDALIWELQNQNDLQDRINILRMLKLFNAQIDYNSYIRDLEHTKNMTFNDLLQILSLKQLCNIPCSTDSVRSFKKETLFGNVYFADDTSGTTLQNNTIQNTILAYQILKKDSLTDPATLRRIRNYFLEVRHGGYWENTYESAQIIETILPDLMTNKSRPENSGLNISGDILKTVKDFPFEMTLDPNQKITVTKTGDFPIYLTAYQRYWDADPVARKNVFAVSTHFDGVKGDQLSAGKEVTFVVDVTMKKDAEYIMLNIPIPAGCSYGDKEKYYGEAHREYFKNETTIFCEKLLKGDHRFEVKLIPRYTGKYTLNPSKIELMYFPVFNANNVVKKVVIK